MMKTTWLACWAALSLFGMATTACGGAVTADDSPDGEGGAGTTNTGGSTSSTSSQGGAGGTGGSAGAVPNLPLEPFCGDACASPDPTGCTQTSTCVDDCHAKAGAWSTTTREAYRTCIETDPLCFVTVEGCMLMALRQEHEPTFIVEGIGLEAYEGRVVHTIVDTTSDSAVISGGAFQIEVLEPQAWDTQGPHAQLFIDVDGDGHCNPEIDAPMSQELTWNGDFDDPIYRLLVTPPLHTFDPVCTSF